MGAKTWLVARAIARVVKIGGPAAVAIFVLWAAVTGGVDKWTQCGMDLTCHSRNVEIPEVLQ